MLGDMLELVAPASRPESILWDDWHAVAEVEQYRSVRSPQVEGQRLRSLRSRSMRCERVVEGVAQIGDERRPLQRQFARNAEGRLRPGRKRESERSHHESRRQSH